MLGPPPSFLSYYFPAIHVAIIFRYVTSIYHLDFSDTTLTAQYDDYYMMSAPIHRGDGRGISDAGASVATAAKLTN
jgi:hypothetical protein